MANECAFCSMEIHLHDNCAVCSFCNAQYHPECWSDKTGCVNCLSMMSNEAIMVSTMPAVIRRDVALSMRLDNQMEVYEGYEIDSDEFYKAKQRWEIEIGQLVLPCHYGIGLVLGMFFGPIALALLFISVIPILISGIASIASSYFMLTAFVRWSERKELKLRSLLKKYPQTFFREYPHMIPFFERYMNALDALKKDKDEVLRIDE